MNKVKRLTKGDKVAIVSLSLGILGEAFASHELVLGEKRLKEFGLEPVYMENSKKGIEFLKNHPQARASDLKQAFADNSIKAIFCAIGGNDTYKTVPYLMQDEEFVSLVKNNPKIFMGFSDTTTNHLMFYKLGLCTFYGPAFLVDFAELDSNMLPYTKNAIDYLFNPKNNYEITSSEVWYNEREDYSAKAVGTPRICNKEMRGYDLIKGRGKVQGELLGGCIDSFGLLLGLRESDDTNEKEAKEIAEQYKLLPTAEEFANKIMFFETSNSKISPNFLQTILEELKSKNIFKNLAGVIIGKPHDETYYNEYRKVIENVFADFDYPILYNLNFGHSAPRTIIPYGALAEIDADNCKFKIISSTIK